MDMDMSMPSATEGAKSKISLTGNISKETGLTQDHYSL